MNILFVDIDGVLNSFSYKESIVDRMVKVLSNICDKYNCKVVIESTHKPRLYDFEEESQIILDLYSSFKKYNIECIGFTPRIEITDNNTIVSVWKDFEIIYYLQEHPEIDHFAVIDDNDYIDLVLLKEYLIETKAYVKNNKEEEGLLEKHIDEVGKVLKLDNKFKKIMR